MESTLFSIRSQNADDWRQVRDLRIEMVRDTPIAFGETLEATLAFDEVEWKRRADRGTVDGSIAIAAISESGRWIGTMSAYLPDDATGPLLVGVYVTPDFRGKAAGVTDSLLQRIETWARIHGTGLTLHVHEDNSRAQAAYAHRGFVATGRTAPYVVDLRRDELEMVKTF